MATPLFSATTRPVLESAVRPSYVLVLSWPVETTGGVNEVVFALAEQLTQRGWHPIIAVATGNLASVPKQYRGFEVIGLRLPDPWHNQKGWRMFGSFCKTAWIDAIALRRFLHDRNVRVLNLHFPGLNIFLPAFLRSWGLLPATLVVSCHGSDITDLRQSTSTSKRFWHYSLRRADVVTACSGSLSRELHNIFSDVPVQTIHNGIDQSLFKHKGPAANHPPLILHVGKFEYKKGHDVLLRAFSMLLARGFDARLHLVGSAGPAMAEVEALVARLGLSPQVDIRVNVPHREIPVIMQNADIFVLPSRAEPFGLVVLEAGASGLPVVATHVGGVPELLTDGETGLLVPPDDEVAVADALQRLLQDPDYASRLAGRFYEQVKTRWSWEQTAGLYLDAVQSGR